MKTKREVLELTIKHGSCYKLKCSDCPYYVDDDMCGINHISRLAKIGAMAILRQNRKKREFDPNKVLTCVTADKAKVGMKGYFSDNLADLRKRFAQKNIRTLTIIFSEEHYARFGADNSNWVLFYPIDEVEK